MKNYIYIYLLLLLGLSSCEEFLDPKITEERTLEELLTQPEMIRGLVTSAYNAIPSVYDNSGGQFLDVATDNALTNELTDGLNKMVEFPAYWNSTNNPISTWNARYENIKNLNKFFDIMENNDVVFKKSDSTDNENYTKHIIGEAFFLRAWAQFDLLSRFGGVDVNNELLGFPIIKKVLTQYNYPQLERNTYMACVQQIMDDLDSAMVYLPAEWMAKVWDENEGEEVDNADPYTNLDNLGRPTVPVCLALKSRVLLYAASPAYNSGSGVKWSDAALASFEIVDSISNGSWQLPDIYNLNTISATYYNDPQNDEIIYRKMQGTSNGDKGIEERNFPPSYYGNGKCNPTQNLVDAFPMADGAPYDPVNDANMYENRDRRFYMTVLYNGAIFKNDTIQTYNGGKDMVGGANATINNTTRTGYYIRKWMSDGVSLVPGNTTNDKHYNATFRKAEMFLNFAETANEAVGPDVAINGRTAREAIAEVRRRAGISTDNYLTSITTQDDMRELIKNERRIELCFEGHRFFDLRRWKDQLNTMVQKIDIEQTAPGVFANSRVDLFNLAYDNSKFYCPLPMNELNKTEKITQNQGW